MILKKKELILIPSYVSLTYFKRNKIIILKSSEKVQFLTFYFLLDLLLLKNKCYVTTSFLTTSLNRRKTRTVFIKKNQLHLKIKECLVETNHRFYKKLNLVGVGYKVFKTKSYTENEILLFKLGFSHLIFLKINNNSSNIVCLKNIKIFITGNLIKVNQLSALIKSLKKPEAYKGKGIRFQDEKIILKQVKKK